MRASGTTLIGCFLLVVSGQIVVGGQAQVDVLQAGPVHGQPVQHRAALQGPAGQPVQLPGRVGGLHGDQAVGRDDAGWQVVGRAAGRQGEPDPGPGVISPADGRRRALGHDLAVGDHRHPVGQGLGLVHVVRGEQDSGARGAQAAHDLPGLAAGARVEPGGRLVQEQQPGVADHPQGQVQPPLLAAGQGPDLPPRLRGQADQGDDLVDVARGRVVAGVAGQRLADREVRLDRDVLQHQADLLAQGAAARPVARVAAEHLGPAGVAAAEPLQDLQRGGLARAVRPEQREDLAVRDSEAHPAHGRHRAVALGQPGHDDRAGRRDGATVFAVMTSGMHWTSTDMSR